MRILLAAINAKYIHSNPAIHSLKAAAEEAWRRKSAEKSWIAVENRLPDADGRGLSEEMPSNPVVKQNSTKNSADRLSMPEIILGEYTINHTTESVRADIYRKRPDILAFSCYIWNITYVKTLAADLKKLLPETEIWLGGPEVSWHCREILEEMPAVTGIMVGPGEKTFSRLTEAWMKKQQASSRADESCCCPDDSADSSCCCPDDSADSSCCYPDDSADRPDDHAGDYGMISGLVYRDPAGSIISTGEPEAAALNDLPFWYGDLKEYENRIIYYESTRGCPFACSYCLSSIDKTLQFRDIAKVKRELQFFLDRKVPQVKFIDRTFNCRESHALAIWEYIAAHDNGVTNFHFEIAADILTDREMKVLSEMRPSLVQLEIGVQSANPETLKAIRRPSDLSVLAENTAGIRAAGNIHQHLDLIAGLPFEDYESFGRSFDVVYGMHPDQLQLGFLKVLKGTRMEEEIRKNGLIYTDQPPYEVMSTKWLSYEDVLRLKGVEDAVEIYYNSGQFTKTLEHLVREFGRPFTMFERLAEFRAAKGHSVNASSRTAKYELLLDFARSMDRDPTLCGGIQQENEGIAGGATAAEREAAYRELLTEDCYLRENMKNRPSFAPEQTEEDRELWKAVIRREAGDHVLFTGYEKSGYREMMNQLHGEVLRVNREEPELVIFDYRNRDPLSHNAGVWRMSLTEAGIFAGS